MSSEQREQLARQPQWAQRAYAEFFVSRKEHKAAHRDLFEAFFAGLRARRRDD